MIGLISSVDREGTPGQQVISSEKPGHTFNAMPLTKPCQVSGDCDPAAIGVRAWNGTLPAPVRCFLSDHRMRFTYSLPVKTASVRKVLKGRGIEAVMVQWPEQGAHRSLLSQAQIEEQEREPMNG
ncbi:MULTISPECIES: hypothetical protein [unclassified Synechococcus]|uniref:hypothetical protein n=1 Tax=unclassified Synechococcus TaxID=2626047 RepID=UPI0012EA2B7D|nr:MULTISPECIES: hypothetical protein [unclassified Synechococcus]WFN58149.1 hypothetical protein N4320_10000 [Synechococcus sp. CCFWC 502]